MTFFLRNLHKFQVFKSWPISRRSLNIPFQFKPSYSSDTIIRLESDLWRVYCIRLLRNQLAVSFNWFNCNKVLRETSCVPVLIFDIWWERQISQRTVRLKRHWKLDIAILDFNWLWNNLKCVNCSWKKDHFEIVTITSVHLLRTSDIEMANCSVRNVWGGPWPPWPPLDPPLANCSSHVYDMPKNNYEMIQPCNILCIGLCCWLVSGWHYLSETVRRSARRRQSLRRHRRGRLIVGLICFSQVLIS
jgi:hypothetical protein